MTPQAWIAANLAKVAAIAVIVLCIAGLLVAKSCSDARKVKTETTLSKNQTDAALASGKDAVETVGNQQAAETATHDTVKGSQDEIAQAKPGDSNAAAERATCRLRSYRNLPKCVALLGPVTK